MTEKKQEDQTVTESLPSDHFLFTSESVGEGHPDKLCDQISDAVLDACLQVDPKAKVLCEVSAKRNKFYILGELDSSAGINIKDIVAETIKQVGYDSKDKGLDYRDIEVTEMIQGSPSEPAETVYVQEEDKDVYTDNQGVMFGYATDEWDEEALVPLTHYLASKICERISECRKLNIIPWLRPDCKSQVTVEYKREGNLITPIRVHNVLVSAQHDPDIGIEEIHKEILDKVVKQVIPPAFVDANTLYYINPSKSFVIGGPMADAGLTGRKIVVDTYGGWAPHGGGSFSGKDPTKIERSGAYYARYVAKSLVHHKLCHRVLVQVSYALGMADPLAIYIDSYGTVKEGMMDEDLMNVVRKNFNFRLNSIIDELQLRQPVYSKTSVFGHFGRDGPEFTWEVPKAALEY